VRGNTYTRIMNPTPDVLEQRVTALALTSSQVATTYSILTIAEAGDNIVSSRRRRSTTAPTTCSRARCRSTASIRADARTKAIFVESLATHPAPTTHRQLSPEELDQAGVSEDAVRLSVRIEHVARRSWLDLRRSWRVPASLALALPETQ
jgi:O-acetylhomoserine/O-acetylserine sulfhydrylase-like pyridoxal-dependent enzyme